MEVVGGWRGRQMCPQAQVQSCYLNWPADPLTCRSEVDTSNLRLCGSDSSNIHLSHPYKPWLSSFPIACLKRRKIIILCASMPSSVKCLTLILAYGKIKNGDLSFLEIQEILFYDMDIREKGWKICVFQALNCPR